MNDFLRKAFYCVLGKIFKNNQVEPPIDLNSRSKILIFRYDKIGDMVVSMPSFEMLKFYLPDSEIWVLTSETNSFLLKNYKSITGFVIYPKFFLKKIKTIYTLRHKKFDVIINYVFHRTTKAGLLANLINTKAIKVTLGHSTRDYLYSRLFNLLFPMSLRQKAPMSEFLCQYLEWIFGVEPKKEFQTCYNFFIPEDSLKIAKQFINSIPHRIKLLVNISGRKKWSIVQYKEFILLVKQNLPDVGLIFVAHPNDNKMLKAIVRGENNNVYPYYSESNSFYEVISLVKFADLVFTYDTSIVHFANAFKVPAIIIYPKEGSAMDEWLPNNIRYEKYISRNNKDNNDVLPSSIVKGLQRLILSL